MKILIVSNFFPPHSVGGYELGCHEVANGLRNRGHKVRVLTSTHGENGPVSSDDTCRVLHVRSSVPSGLRKFPTIFRDERHNVKCFRDQVQLFQPDIVYLWNLQFGCLSLAFAAERTGLPVAYFVSDNWFANFGCNDDLYYRINGKTRTVREFFTAIAIKAGLKISGLEIPKGIPKPSVVHCCSEYIRSVALQQHESLPTEVVHWGVDTEKYKTSAPRAGSARRFLFVGRLVLGKGVHTALEAFLRVAERRDDISLSIAGGGGFLSNCEPMLRDLVNRSTARDKVQFLGKLPRDQVVKLYEDHDALLFPTEQPEPFSIALVEAFSSGLGIIGTQTGGTPEILVDGETGTTFKAGDVSDCANAIERVATDAETYVRLRECGQNNARTNFTIDRMVTRIEDSLKAILLNGEVSDGVATAVWGK
jgi:glycogen synthase